MGTGSFGGKLGIIAEANVVPLIDILLVLLVIFMVIPHWQFGLDADLPHQVDSPGPYDPPGVIIVRVASDGTVWINQGAVNREELGGRLERLFAARHDRIAFLQGDRSLEFQRVAQVLDLMHSAGASPVGLLTSELEKKR